MVTSFLSCSLRLYFEFCFRVFKGIGFPFYNYITYFTSFIIAFGNPLCCVFSEYGRGEYSFKIFAMFLAFNDFCCVEYFFYFFDFVIVLSFSKFFIISVNSPGLVFLVDCNVCQGFLVAALPIQISLWTSSFLIYIYICIYIYIYIYIYSYFIDTWNLQ